MSYRHNISPLSIVVAVDQQGGFGKDGKIPWHVPEDLKHFKSITKGGVCIMGRRTYEDMFEMIKSRQKKKKTLKNILPNRESIVLTSNEKLNVEGATIASSLVEAVQSLKADDTREIFAIGGARVFTEALIWTTTIYMTIIKGNTYNCDRFFPLEYVKSYFKLIKGNETDKCQFITYKRIKK